MGLAFKTFLQILVTIGGCFIVLFALPTHAAENYFKTNAPYAVILDGATGKILFSKSADVPIPPASMSKLMTAAITLDEIKAGRISKETMFKVSKKAWQTGGSKMFVLVNTEIRVEDLLKGLLVHSGNDAAVVLAENISGSEEAFVELMNQRAREWGMTQSEFANPNGNDHPNHNMSVMDLASLARKIWYDYPEDRYLFSIRSFTWSDIEQTNRNPLLASFDGADGMKTGYTEDAGWGVVGTASRDDARRFVVVAGFQSSKSRNRSSIRMMDRAFKEFDTRAYFRPGDVVYEADVLGSKTKTLPLTIAADVEYTLHKSQLNRAKAKVIYRGPLLAPIAKGEQVALLRISMPDAETIEYPLYAAQRVRELGVLAKMGLGLRILFTPPDEEGLQ